MCKASEMPLALPQGTCLLSHFHLTLCLIARQSASLLQCPPVCLLFPHHYSGKCLAPHFQLQSLCQFQPLLSAHISRLSSEI